MSVITWPDFGVSSFRWKKANKAIAFRSVFGAQAIEAATPLWEVDITGAIEARLTGISIQTFLESLNGFGNQLSLWNIGQTAPAGTMRGTMTLSADAAQGATSLVIDAGVGQAAKTLLAGDLVGLGSGLTQQVLRVSADATANGSGVITVIIGTALRNAFSAGAAVTWDKPAALFRVKEIPPALEFVGPNTTPWSLSLIEDWRP